MINFNLVKVAFFDLDGTLSIPRYESRSGVGCGMPDNVWFDYNNRSSNTYRDCLVNPKAVGLLRDLRGLGVELKVLTLETFSGAYFNKVRFVLEKYPEFFEGYEDVLFVSGREDKTRMLKSIAKGMGLSHSEMLLVDDNFDVCLQANNEGFQVMHVSELFVR